MSHEQQFGPHHPETDGSYYGDHEKLAMDHDTIEFLEGVAKDEAPELTDAAISGVVDASLLQNTESILHHPHSAEFNAKIMEAASLIAVKGADEFYGERSDETNPIVVLELNEHGELLDNVLQEYIDAGSYDDATLLANAIDGLTQSDVFLAEKEQGFAGFNDAPKYSQIGQDSLHAAMLKVDHALGAHLDFVASPAVDELNEEIDDDESLMDPNHEDDDYDDEEYEYEDEEDDVSFKDHMYDSLEDPEYDGYDDGEDGEVEKTGEDEDAVERRLWTDAKYPLDDTVLAKVLSHSLSPTEQQFFAESTYEISIGPADPELTLDVEEIKSRFEVDHVVKRAPKFKDQVQDTERTNLIIRLNGFDRAMNTKTSRPDLEQHRAEESEHDVLLGLHTYLEEATVGFDILDDYRRKQAGSMLDNLTFIGEKEYNEATAGIAEYWKACMEANPKLQVLALAGMIGNGYVDENNIKPIKSDEYLLDNVLKHFSDEECIRYAGRLITDQSHITVGDAEDLKVVLLDDWTISGNQLKGVRDEFLDLNPEFKNSVEVQLITANEKRVTRGLEYGELDKPWTKRLGSPVRAYYLAHTADMTYARYSGAHITGAHSAVDYDFENECESITYQANEHFETLDAHQRILTTLPAAANIVRPYRVAGVKLEQKARLERLRLRAADSRHMSSV